MIEDADLWKRKIEENLEGLVCRGCPLSTLCCKALPSQHCKAFDGLVSIEMLERSKVVEKIKGLGGKGEPKKPKTTNFVKWLFLSAWKVLKWIVKKWKDHIRGKKNEP